LNRRDFYTSIPPRGLPGGNWGSPGIPEGLSSNHPAFKIGGRGNIPIQEGLNLGDNLGNFPRLFSANRLLNLFRLPGWFLHNKSG